MGWALHRAGAWRGSWLYGGDVRWSDSLRTLAFPCSTASAILERDFYHHSASAREVKYGKLGIVCLGTKVDSNLLASGLLR